MYAGARPVRVTCVAHRARAYTHVRDTWTYRCTFHERMRRLVYLANAIPELFICFCPAAPTENASIYEPTLLESRARAWVPSCSRPTWLCCSDARSVLSFLYATSVSRFSTFVSVISLVSLSLSLSPYLSTSLSVSLVFSFFLFLSFPLSSLLSFPLRLCYYSSLPIYLFLLLSLRRSVTPGPLRDIVQKKKSSKKIAKKRARLA